ncbi:MAG: DUF5681 domain-containing protein [Roseiarcus sp.]|jgi:hypothetical protein
MTAHSPSQDKPPKNYTVGYGKPPEKHQFQQGQRANPHGRPKGRPSIDQLLLEEVARLIKIKVGDEVIHVSKERAMLRKLIDLALQGDVAAARLVLSLRDRAQIALEVAPQAEEPLTTEELEALKLMRKTDGN